MNITWKKALLPFAVVAVGALGMTGISATGGKTEEKEAVDTRPTVRVEALKAEDYQVVISSFGAVEPLERTVLAAQVSGEVVNMHPNFVAGGLVERGEVLFTVEKTTYEAALMQAEAAVSQANASLIEEQARADVAADEAKRASTSKITDLYLRKPQLLSAKAALKSAQAQLKIAKRDLRNCDVKAPYDALVVSRDLGKGQYVSMGARAGELYNIEYAEVTFPVAGFDTTFLPDDMEGQVARVKIDGVQPTIREGQIVRDMGLVDNATRMSHLVVRVQDPYSLSGELPVLKFGAYTEVNFIGKTLENVFKLPQELVTNQTVWVVDDEKRLEPRTVAVLREEGEFFLISDGLSDQDRLVMTVPEYPQKGMEVKFADDATSLDEGDVASDLSDN